MPASGFYEWKTAGNRKGKYLIRSASDKLIYFAGLYSSFTNKTGAPFTGFVIITAAANSQMSQIHNRMPVILSNAEASSWIKDTAYEIGNSTYFGDNIHSTDISSLLKPYSHSLSFELIG